MVKNRSLGLTNMINDINLYRWLHGKKNQSKATVKISCQTAVLDWF